MREWWTQKNSGTVKNWEKRQFEDGSKLLGKRKSGRGTVLALEISDEGKFWFEKWIFEDESDTEGRLSNHPGGWGNRQRHSEIEKLNTVINENSYLSDI